MTNLKDKIKKSINRGMIFPDKIEVGERIINQYDFIEEIYKVNKFKDLTYFRTLEKVHDGVEIHRFYKLQGDDLNKGLKKISQSAYDREFRIGLGGKPLIPLLK